VRKRKLLSKAKSSSSRDCSDSEISSSGPPETQQVHILDETDDEAECGYEGGVENPASSDDEFDPTLHWELEDDEEWDSDEELSEYFLICTIPPNWGVQKLLSPSVLKLVKFCLGKSFLLLKGVISQEI
jgi:hypothetical protein